MTAEKESLVQTVRGQIFTLPVHLSEGRNSITTVPRHERRFHTPTLATNMRRKRVQESKIVHLRTFCNLYRTYNEVRCE